MNEYKKYKTIVDLSLCLKKEEIDEIKTGINSVIEDNCGEILEIKNSINRDDNELTMIIDFRFKPEDYCKLKKFLEDNDKRIVRYMTFELNRPSVRGHFKEWISSKIKSCLGRLKHILP